MGKLCSSASTVSSASLEACVPLFLNLGEGICASSGHELQPSLMIGGFRYGCHICRRTIASRATLFIGEIRLKWQILGGVNNPMD